jgi:dCTP deaminase
MKPGTGTLVDRQIAQLAQSGLIDPFDQAQVNPASYDVRLGSLLLTEVDPSKTYPEEAFKGDGRWAKHPFPESGYIFEPGEFILGCTEEVFNLPSDIEAVFQLKSSRGREGFEHVLSGYIDPGFAGRLTLELVNVNRYHSLLLKPGMLIGQIRFTRLSVPPERDYSVTGHYQNDMVVQPSKVDPFGVVTEEQVSQSIDETVVFPEP